jgi:two-component system, OmpR family, sensor histidine kinase VicK
MASSQSNVTENLWKETELYEQLKLQDIMQKEFINIAAHELKTPIQPILGINGGSSISRYNAERIY